MTANELGRRISAGMFRTIDGFFCDGNFYNMYAVIDETTIAFSFTKDDVFNRKIVNINRVNGIEKIWAYNEREKRKLPYDNVILKD